MDLSYITNQFHSTYNSKINIWKLIDNSYAGGTTYRDNNYLHRYALRESDISYQERKKRSIYLNNVQTLADMFIGFIYNSEPVRTNIKSEYLIEKATPRQSLKEFMISVATNSILYSCGILVDSPKFNPSEYPTEASRKSAGLNPYCILYQPWDIRNYHIDRNGKLVWILLDNSYIDNSDPFKQSEYKIFYRLWTQEFIQDFESSIQLTSATNISSLIAQNQMGDFKASEQYPLPENLTEIPFHFQNWKDKNNCQMSDTIFEDIALIDQSIYNYMSLFDEILFGGTFKTLFYPDRVPDELKSDGSSNYMIAPFPGTGAPPFFDGPGLQDIDPFLQAINFLIIGIQRALGLNTDQEKNYAQSGEAKKFDFTKTKALLMSGAESLERCEKEMFRFASMWEGVDDGKAEIDYKKDFMGSEQEQELARLYEMLLSLGDVQSIYKHSAKRIANINFSDILNGDELKEIETDIEKSEITQPEPGNGQEMTALMDAEIKSRQVTGDGKSIE